MIKLDDNLMTELGLGPLPKAERDEFLKHMYETLEMRVGTRLAERMSNQQMSEFERFIQSNDEQGAFQWLEANFPNYKEVVAEEFEKLKSEVRPLVSQILAASQAHAAQAGVQSPAVPADNVGAQSQAHFAQQPPAPHPANHGPTAADPGSFVSPAPSSGVPQAQSFGPAPSSAFGQPQPMQPQPTYGPAPVPQPQPMQPAGSDPYAALAPQPPAPAAFGQAPAHQPQPAYGSGPNPGYGQPLPPAPASGAGYGPAPSNPHGPSQNDHTNHDDQQSYGGQQHHNQ